MKKIMGFTLLVFAALSLTGCVGGVFESIGNFFTGGGEPGPTGADKAADVLFSFGKFTGISALAAVGGLLKVATSAVKTKNALVEATDAAIEDGSLGNARSKKALKKALAEAQAAHKHAKLVAKEFDKRKNGSFVKKLVSKIPFIGKE